MTTDTRRGRIGTWCCKVSRKYLLALPYSTQKYARDVQYVENVESIGKCKNRLFYGASDMGMMRQSFRA